MVTDVEIFNNYALLRITGDWSVYTSDFPSNASPSLNYLSKISGVGLIAANKGKWVRDEDPIQPELYMVEDITALELEKKRAQNIENITKKFSLSLASRIKQFEIYTKDFFDEEKKYTKEATEFFKKAIALLPSNPSDMKMLAARKALQQRVDQNEEAFKPWVDPFHELIKKAYHEKDLMKKADLLKKMYGMTDSRDLADVQKFLKNNKRISEKRFRTELKRDIATQLRYCYQYYGGRNSDVMFWQQEIDYHNSVLRGYKTRLLGPKGAFDLGGIYGLDSPVMNFNTKEGESKGNSGSQKEKTLPEGTQLSIFTDQDLGY